MAVAVQLQASELVIAAMVGVLRQVNNLQKGRMHKYGCEDADGFKSHVNGAIGELVVAKHRNVYWCNARRGDKDVDGAQVRYAQRGGALILHPDDADDDIFWLVRGDGFDYTVEGWLHGREGKLPKYWEPEGRGKNGRPAFFVPVQVLHDPHEEDQP